MEVKEYLKQYQAIKRNIEILKIEIDHLYNRPKTVKFGEVSGTASGDMMLRTVLDIEKKKNEYSEMLKQYYQMRTEIVEAIINIPNPEEKQALYEYYITGKAVVDIADIMGYSVPHIYRIMTDGREAICQKLKLEKK